MTSKSKTNQLDRASRTKFTLWVARNEQLLTDKTDQECAEAASAELGFRIVPGNIKTERQIQFPDLDRKTPGSPIIAMVRKLEARLSALEKALGVNASTGGSAE